MEHSGKEKISLHIHGMTCESCSLLLERKLGAIKGVSSVSVDHRNGQALLICNAAHPSKKTLAAVIHEAGYYVKGEGALPVAEQQGYKWIEIGVALLIVFAIGKLLLALDLVSLAPSTSGALTVGGIFLIGLVAGTSSCLAVTGGLLLAVAAKYNETHQTGSGWQKITPLLHFNIGRLISYFFLGGVAGVLGQTVTLSIRMTGVLNILVAFVMLYLALTILQIVPKGSFPLRPPRWLSRRIAALSDNNHPAAPFALGALSFFLPCGFTQSLQLAALASGSFATGALIMGTFALGTMPALLGLSALSATMRGAGSRWFLRLSGAAVLMLSLVNVQSGLALTGIHLPGMSPSGFAGPVTIDQSGVQEVSMVATAEAFEPDLITIKVGVPVRWKVDGTRANGCTSVLTIPALNITKYLTSGINIIEFTAPEKGNLAFSCGMGMVRGNFTVL